MINWLTSEIGTYVVVTALLALYLGFVVGILVNAYYICGEGDDDDDGGDSMFPPAPDFPPDELAELPLADHLPKV